MVESMFGSISSLLKLGGKAVNQSLQWYWQLFSVLALLLSSGTALATITQCPTNRTVSAGANCTVVLGSFTNELKFHPPAATSIVQNPAAGAAVAVGQHLIVFIVTRPNGSNETCSLLLTVVDSSV